MWRKYGKMRNKVLNESMKKRKDISIKKALVAAERIYKDSIYNNKYLSGIVLLKKIQAQYGNFYDEGFFCKLGLLYDHAALSAKKKIKEEYEEKALILYRTVLKKNPSSCGAAWGIGRVWWHRKSKRAIRYAMKAYRLAKRQGIKGLYAQNIGLIYEVLGDYKKAELWLFRGVKENPAEWGNYLNLVTFYRLMKDFDKSVYYADILKKKIKREPPKFWRTKFGKMIKQSIKEAGESIATIKNPMGRVKFVINKKLDIANHIIGVNSYAKKLHSLNVGKNEKYERLLKLSLLEKKKTIAKEIDWFYFPKNKEKRERTLKKIQIHWDKIEKDYFSKLEEIHERPFSYKKVRGILSTANRFGYDTGKDCWFATDFKNGPFRASYVAMHELMHFMFHKHFWKFCEKNGLSWKQIWDIKESMTILLNIEFYKLLFGIKDSGYPEHQKIRAFIKKSWPRRKNFKSFLLETCSFVKNK